jgi:hypothetical protein
VKRRKASRRKAKAGRKSWPVSLLDLKPPAKRPKSTPEQEAELAELVRDIYQTMAEGAGLAGPREQKELRLPKTPELASAATTIEPEANLPSPAEWLVAEVKRRKEAGDIPTEAGAVTKFATELKKQMDADVKARKCRRAILCSSIRVRLYEMKLWPVE